MAEILYFDKKGYRRLFIMRKDLSMSPGKLAGQVSHCAEAYWLNLIRQWCVNPSIDTSFVDISGILDKDIYNKYVDGAIDKVICKAKNKNHLMRAYDMALDMGFVENVDFGLIADKCLTELEPEEPDGRTITGIWFRPLPEEVAKQVSKKYQLYS